LSIPLVNGRNQRVPVNEVTISNAERWQSRHWKSIQSAYSRSPFFEFYRDDLQIIFNRPVTLLADWNLTCLNWIKEKLKWSIEFRQTDTVIPYQSPGLDDRRGFLVPKNYLNWDPVRYRQVFEEKTGFSPNLSILDLLFNTGREAGALLRNSNLIC
jgi:hypothetical protein